MIKIQSTLNATTTTILIIISVISLIFGSVLQQVNSQLSPNNNNNNNNNRQPCPRAIQIQTTPNFRNKFHFVCLSQFPVPQLDVIDLGSGESVYSRNLLTSDPTLALTPPSLLASFVDSQGVLRILVASPDKLNGTSLFSVTPTNQANDEVQTINTQLVSAMSAFRLELTYGTQLAIANEPLLSNDHSKIYIPQTPIISMMAWRSTYFDSYQQLVIPFNAHVTKIEPFSVNGIDFLAVCTRPSKNAHLLHNDAKNRQAATLIYRLYFSTGILEWRLHQELNLRISLDARAFELRSKFDSPSHHYLAFIGQEPLTDFSIHLSNNTNIYRFGHPSPQLGLVIYKYFGGVFALTKFQPLPDAVRLDAISSVPGSQAVIAVVSITKPNIILFSFDGTQLTQLVSPPSMPTRPVNVHLFSSPQSTMQVQSKRTLSTDENNSTSTLDETWIPKLVYSTTQQAIESNQQENSNDEDDDLLIGMSLASKGNQEQNASQQSNTLKSNMYETQASSLTNTDDKSIYQISLPSQSNIASSDNKLSSSSRFDYDTVIDNTKVNETNRANNNTSSESNKDNDSDAQIARRQYIPSGPQQQRQDDLLGWCKARIDQLKRDQFDSLSNQMRSLARLVETPSGEFVEFTGDLFIDGDLEITEQLNAANILETPPLPNTRPRQLNNIVRQQDLLLPDFRAALATLTELQKELSLVAQRVDQLLVDDGSIQEVFAPVEFDELVIDCQDWTNAQKSPHSWHLARSCPHVDELNTPFLNNNNITNIRENVLVTGRPITINRDVRFERLVLQGNTQINGRLNNLHIDNIVFKKQQPTTTRFNSIQNSDSYSPQANFVAGHKEFAGGLFVKDANLHVSSWNGEQVNEHTVLTASNHYQSVETELKVNKIILANSPVKQLSGLMLNKTPTSSHIANINNLHLDSFLNSIVTAGDNATIDAPLEIDELELVGPVQLSDLTRNGGAFISGVDLIDLWNNVLTKSTAQNITAPMHFSNLHISHGSNIQVNGPVNGVNFVPNNILMKSSNAVIGMPVIIKGDVKVNNDLDIGKSLNNIPILPPQQPTTINSQQVMRPQLAIMLDYGDQIISGAKQLSHITLAGNSTINGPINGYLDLGQLYKLAVRTNDETFAFQHVRLAGSEIKRLAPNFGSLHVSRSINGVPINDVCQTARFASNLQSPVRYSRVRLEEPASFKQLHCASINGFSNLPSSFLMRYSTEPQHVKGIVRFAGGVTFNSSLVINERLNNLDARNLSTAIQAQLTETITQRKVVYGDLILDELYADRIDNLNLRDVFIANSKETQVIRSPMIVDDLDIENVLTINTDARFGSFNNINITDILTNSLQYDTPQVVHAPIELQTLRIGKNSRLSTNALNGIDLRSVMADAVLVDVPQQIIGQKTFVGPVDLRGKAFVRHTINGLTHDELRLSYLLNSDDANIDGDLVFNSDVVVNKELDIESGLINDINVNSFANSMLYENKTRPQQQQQQQLALPAPMIVRGNGTLRFNDLSANNLVVGGTIQGVDVSREIFRQQQEHMLRQQNQPPNSYAVPLQIFRGANNFSPTTVSVQQQQFLRNQSMSHVNVPTSTFRSLESLQTTTPIATPLIRANANVDHMLPVWQNQSSTAGLVSTSRAFSPLPLINTQSSQKQVQQSTFDLERNIAQFEAHEISKLASRISPLVPLALYYTLFESHALHGPFLHATKNPDSSLGSLLLLKSVGQREDPCAAHNQSVAVWQQQPDLMFAQNSVLTGTSSPLLVESMVTSDGRHILFVANIERSRASPFAQMLVYTWHSASSRYELASSFGLPDYPTDMKTLTFFSSELNCVAIAMPRAVRTDNQQSLRGAPSIYCESEKEKTNFLHAIDLNDNVGHVFKLSALQISAGEQVLMAAISHVENARTGDLTLWLLESSTQPRLTVYQQQQPNLMLIKIVASRLAPRRLIQPLAVHLFTDKPNADGLSGAAGQVVARLAVSEAAVTTDGMTTGSAQTRLYALESWRLRVTDKLRPNSTRLVETQVIKDAQYSDIQSIPLTNHESAHSASLLFLKSSHFISIFGPSKASDSFQCAPSYELIQRLPTKGATKFSVFASNISSQQQQQLYGVNATSAMTSGNFQQQHTNNYAQHFLALSRDDCQSQEFSTIILQSNFVTQTY